MITDNSRLRVGVIGTGSHASENLLPAIKLHSEYQLAAISSRSLDRAIAYGEKYSIPNVTSNWREIATSHDLDAVVVSATPSFHSEVICCALSSGLHVFVEKPPAPDARALVRLADIERERSDKVVFVDFNFRFAEAVSLARTALDFEGRLVHGRFRFVSSKPREPLWGQSTVEQSLLYAVGIHGVEMAHAWFGRPTSVHASSVKIGAARIAMCVNLEFNSGSMVSLELGNYSNRFESHYELVWENGAVATVKDQTEIAIHGSDRFPINFGPKSTLNSTVPSSRGGFNRAGYDQAFTEFARAIRERKPSPCSLAHCVGVYETIDEIIAQTGCERNK